MKVDHGRGRSLSLRCRVGLIFGFVLVLAAPAAQVSAAPQQARVTADLIDPKLRIEDQIVDWRGTITDTLKIVSKHQTATQTIDEEITLTTKITATAEKTEETSRYSAVETNTFAGTFQGQPCTETQKSVSGGSFVGDGVENSHVKAEWYGDSSRYQVSTEDPNYPIKTTATDIGCGRSSSETSTRLWSDLSGRIGDEGKDVDAEGHAPHGVLGLQDNWKRTAVSGETTTTVETNWNLDMCGEESGSQWVNRYPDSKKVADLEPPFRGDVERFLGALDKAYRLKQGRFRNGRAEQVKVPTPIVPFIQTTYRPDPRAYLMHYSFRVAGGKPGSQQFAPLEPRQVPVYANSGRDTRFKPTGLAAVPVCWIHENDNGSADVKASKKAAKEMVAAYGIHKFGAAFPSNHSAGSAIDMNVFWGGPVYVEDAGGTARKIRTGQDLFALADTYGVKKHVGQCGGLGKPDPPHWSLTGC